jgi:hypothetical protein
MAPAFFESGSHRRDVVNGVTSGSLPLRYAYAGSAAPTDVEIPGVHAFFREQAAGKLLTAQIATGVAAVLGIVVRIVS